MLPTQQIQAFSDELQKLALDLRVLDHPGLPVGGAAFDRRPSNPRAAQYHPQVQEMAAGKNHLVALQPTADIRQGFEGVASPFTSAQKDLLADAQYKSNRRHELTHYIRGKAGKMEGVGQPGFRNLLRTAREEGAAYKEGVKPFRKVIESGAFSPTEMRQLEANTGAHAGKGFVSSVRHAYPEGLRRAALGGTLKPLLPLAEKLKLVR